MKKIFVLSLLLAFGLGFQAANAQAFEKGKSGINLGLGVGNTDAFSSYYSFSLPIFSGSYEYGIVDVPMGSNLKGVVSVGGYLGWTMNKYEYWSEDLYILYGYFLISARGNYHFIFHDKFDTYAGISLGYLVVSGKWHGEAAHPENYDFASSKFYPGIYVGARYFFTDHFGVFSELGYQLAVFTVGVSFKF